jgi:hypothetical protein
MSKKSLLLVVGGSLAIVVAGIIYEFFLCQGIMRNISLCDNAYRIWDNFLGALVIISGGYIIALLPLFLVAKKTNIFLTISVLMTVIFLFSMGQNPRASGILVWDRYEASLYLTAVVLFIVGLLYLGVLLMFLYQNYKQKKS